MKVSMKEVFLLEATGNITRILGMPEALASYFEKLDKRFAFPLAKLFKDDLRHISGWEESYRQGIKKLKAGDQDALRSILGMAKEWAEGQYNFNWPAAEIIAALRKNPALEKQVSKVDGSFGLKQVVFSGRGKDKKYVGGKVVLDLGKGWKWVEVPKDCQGIEGSEMQHCGVTDSEKMISLRDPNDKPHVTLDLDSGGTISQIRGKQNEVPAQKYWKAVADLLKHFKSSGTNVFYAEDYEADRTGKNGVEADFQDYLMDQGAI